MDLVCIKNHLPISLAMAEYRNVVSGPLQKAVGHRKTDTSQLWFTAGGSLSGGCVYDLLDAKIAHYTD
jgi:hypothetical protein